MYREPAIIGERRKTGTLVEVARLGESVLLEGIKRFYRFFIVRLADAAIVQILISIPRGQ